MRRSIFHWCILMTIGFLAQHGSTTTVTTTPVDAVDGTTERTVCQPHNLTGPIDIVFVMDRSESLNSANFEVMRDFVARVLRLYSTPSPDEARVAVISFGTNVTVDLNYISRETQAYSCEFFHPQGPFYTSVQYDDDFDQTDSGNEELSGDHLKITKQSLYTVHVRVSRM